MSAKDEVSDAASAWEPPAEPPKPAEGPEVSDTQAETHVEQSNAQQDVPAEPPLEHNLPRAMALYQQPWLDPAEVPVLRLCAIRLGGLKNMRQSFLAALCRPYVDDNAHLAWLAEARYGDRLRLPRPGAPASFIGLVESASALSMDLSRLDIVKDIAVQLEPSSVSNAHPTEDVDIVMRVQPSSRFFLKTSTSVGNSEGTASVQGKVRNVFGGAESLEGSATLGTRTRHSYNAVFTTPVFANPDLWFSISAISQHRDLTGYLGAQDSIHFARSALMYLAGNGVRHELAYEASHRHYHHFLPDASVAIRRLAKPSIKSALSYTLERDTRDDPFLTSVGSYFRSIWELAGLGGDTSYLKTETESHISRLTEEGWVCIQRRMRTNDRAGL